MMQRQFLLVACTVGAALSLLAETPGSARNPSPSPEASGERQERIANVRQRIQERISERLGSPERPAASGNEASTLEEGANCLWIGHSFFVPVARSFDQLATRSDFASHQSDFVFSPGPGGMPGPLWRNESTRERIENQLADGSVDVLGMTTTGPSEDTALEDYRRWIDLALKYNPETRIFIGQPWVPGGPSADGDKYAAVSEAGGEKNFETVEKLRQLYPDTPIYFVNYGLVSSEMKLAFDADALPDIDKLVGIGPGSLYRDAKLGHGGALLLELAALSWLNALYGAEIDEIAHSEFSDEARDIALEVIAKNAPFR